MEDHSRQELLEEYFSSSGVGAPEGVEGFIWLKVRYHLLCYRNIDIIILKVHSMINRNKHLPIHINFDAGKKGKRQKYLIRDKFFPKKRKT